MQSILYSHYKYKNVYTCYNSTVLKQSKYAIYFKSQIPILLERNTVTVSVP